MNMISYEPLFQTMKKKNSVLMSLVNQLCSLLNCKESDIMEYVEDSPNT